MFIVGQILLGLLCIHVFWIYFFVTGTLVRTKQQLQDLDHPQHMGPFSMADLVITTVTGIAITGFVLLLLGFIGFLNAGAFVFWLIIEGLLFKVLKDENILSAQFWLARYALFKRSWSLPALIIYGAFVSLSVPAILPPTHWDSIMYHFAYAVDWANAGQIYTDEFLRVPYFANNFLLLYALMFALKLGTVCHFLTWLCGLLTGLAVYSVIAQPPLKGVENNDRWTARRVSLTALIMALGLGLSPVFLRWVDTGFVDVSIGLFLLTPILCIYIGLQAWGRKYELEFVLIAAFCVGMKITLILFLPFFLISFALLSKKNGQPISRMMVLTTLLLVLSAPWYVRNFIKTGDPITPTLNILFERRDPIWTPADYAGQLDDLMTPKDLGSLIKLPFELFWNTSSKHFREYGTSPVVMLLYVPFIMAILLLFGRVRRWFGWPFVYLNVALLYLLAYWIGISSLARYFLHLFPLYLVYIGVWLNTLLRASGIDQQPRLVRHAANLLVIVSLALVMLFPNPTSRIYYEELVQSNYLQLTNRFSSYRGFLRENLPGYPSAQYIIANLQSNHNQDEKVILVSFENLHYYFRKNRIVSFGDWYGVGRRADLVDSINSGDLSSYLTRFKVGAVLVNLARQRMSDATYLSFTKQLEENHFELQPAQERGTAIYIKTD